MTCSCSSVEGHLTNKSTVFSPTASKYGTQSLLHDHMIAHYNRIEMAKSTIDNKPPQSINKFIKAHTSKKQLQKDKERKWEREFLHSRPSTASGLQPRIDNSLIHTQPVSENNVVKKRPIVRPQSADSARHLQSPSYGFSQSFASKRSSTPISYKTPSNVNRSTCSTPRYKIEMYAEDVEPVIIKGSLFNASSSILSANHWKKQKQERTQMPEQSSLKLDLSSLSLAETIGSEHVEQLLYNASDSLQQPNQHKNNPSQRQYNSTQLLYNSSLSETNPEYRRSKKQEELIAEEQAYLKFIEDVTSDVLARGIFSDRVLNQVFDTHIERRKNQLNEDRMQELLEELREDLKMSVD